MIQIKIADEMRDEEAGVGIICEADFEKAEGPVDILAQFSGMLFHLIKMYSDLREIDYEEGLDELLSLEKETRDFHLSRQK